MKMGNPIHISKEEIPWQASAQSIYINLLDKVLSAKKAPNIIHEMSSKELTEEATYMIYIILAFTLLGVLGSSITLYEFFFEDNRKVLNFRMLASEKNKINRETILEKEKNFNKSHAWIETCKVFLQCFCMIRNGRRILQTVPVDDEIEFIQSLRFASSLWVTFTHVGMLYFSILRNMEQAKPFLELKISQIIFNGFFSTDVFFIISGFLNAYSFYNIYDRRKGNISWIYFYFKRFVRLTPAYMVVLGFYTTLYTYTGTGVIWPTYHTNPVCRNNWWWHLLYINNFEESKKQCMVWCWYLAVDMQCYIVSPIYLVSLLRWPRFGYFLVFATIFGSCATSFTLTYWFNLSDGLSRIGHHLNDIQYFLMKFFEYFDIVYTKAYTRISSYLIGLTLSYYLYQKNILKKGVQNSKITLYCGWILSVSFIWISFFWLFKKDEENLIDTALYNATKSLFFSCGLAWMIYVCLTGQADFLNTCFSWKFLLPLSRLSYCGYLIHLIIILRLFQQVEDAMDFSVISLILMTLYVWALTNLCSFITSILFENPTLNIFYWRYQNHKRTSMLTDFVNRNNPEMHSDIYKIS